MNSSLVKEYIGTVAALNQLVQRRRFRVDDESGYILNNPVAVSINDEIKQQYGLDLVLLDSEDGLLEYGEHLQNKLNNVIKEFYSNSSLNEEIELLDVVKECSIESYLKNNFNGVLTEVAKNPYNPSVKHKSNFTREVLDAVGVTVPTFLFSIKHPEKVHLIDLNSGKYPVNGTRHYLVSSKLKVKNKEVFMLTDLIESYDKPLELHACGCFFFEQSNKRITSPARMFLQGINEYGNEINIEGTKKSFFLQKKIDDISNLMQKGISYKKLGYRGDMTLFFTIATEANDNFYQFSYMLLKDEIISDIKQGIFL
jgi:hypothetical protein